jgi:site-specific recombinase XerD
MAYPIIKDKLTWEKINAFPVKNKNMSVHKLRHTAATLMYQSGKGDIRVLKDVLGHEQLNTTQIYAHVVSRNLEDAVDSNPLADVKIGNKITRQKGEQR